MPLTSILVGIGAGIVRAVFGWAKSEESFDLKKFIRTLIISAISGGIAGVYITDLYQVFAAAFTGTVIIEDLLVAAYKKSK